MVFSCLFCDSKFLSRHKSSRWTIQVIHILLSTILLGQSIKYRICFWKVIEIRITFTFRLSSPSCLSEDDVWSDTWLNSVSSRFLSICRPASCFDFFSNASSFSRRRSRNSSNCTNQCHRSMTHRARPITLEMYLNYIFLQCFDAVGWAAGRASGL